MAHKAYLSLHQVDISTITKGVSMSRLDVRYWKRIKNIQMMDDQTLAATLLDLLKQKEAPNQIF